MYCYTGLREINKHESIADFVTRDADIGGYGVKIEWGNCNQSLAEYDARSKGNVYLDVACQSQWPSRSEDGTGSLTWRKFFLLFHPSGVVKYFPFKSMRSKPPNRFSSEERTTWYSPGSSMPTR